jgi:hypothetical protein
MNHLGSTEKISDTVVTSGKGGPGVSHSRAVEAGIRFDFRESPCGFHLDVQTPGQGKNAVRNENVYMHTHSQNSEVVEVVDEVLNAVSRRAIFGIPPAPSRAPAHFRMSLCRSFIGGSPCIVKLLIDVYC